MHAVDASKETALYISLGDREIDMEKCAWLRATETRLWEAEMFRDCTNPIKYSQIICGIVLSAHE